MRHKGELEANRKELALLRGKRTPETLALWVQSFGEGDPGLAARYDLAVSRFLGGSTDTEQWESYLGKLSPNTRKAYAFALNEFFEWVAIKHGRVVPPHNVLREDAQGYANWLANRPFTLELEKLRDGDQNFRYAVYQVISSLDGNASLQQIEGVLRAWGNAELLRQPGEVTAQRNWLKLQLGRMVLHDELRRTPTLDELRRDFDPAIGIGKFTVQYPPEHEGGVGRLVPLEDVFTYTLPLAKGVSRSTIALRISALGSFWDTLAQGENVKGAEEPIVRFNIFRELGKTITRGFSAEKKQASAGKRMDPHLVPKLMAESNRSRTLPDLRDRALLYFLVFAGARVSEAIQIRSSAPPASEKHKWPGWYDASSEPPSVTIVRKGGKRMTLPMPPTALQMLTEFRAELKRLAAPDDAQSRDPRGAEFIPSDSPRWRYRELAYMPDAPLFPPVSFWGANSAMNYKPLRPNISDRGGTSYRKSFTRIGVHMMLRRLALKAGLSASEAQTVHPHAFRHFAATAMAEGGKDLREIQALLGHESVTTTEGYLAQIESPERLSGQREIAEYLAKLAPPPGAEPQAPAAVRERPPPQVVETTGIARPERRHAPPRAPAPQPVEETEEVGMSERHVAHAEAVLGRLEKQLGGYGWSDLGVLEIVADKVGWDAASDRPERSAEAEADVLVAAGFDPRDELEKQELLAAYAKPAGDHELPIAPELPAPPLTVSHTAEGEVIHDAENHIIAVDGEEPPEGMTPAVLTEVRGVSSPGAPQDIGEKIEFTYGVNKARKGAPTGLVVYTIREEKEDNKTGEKKVTIKEMVQANTKKKHDFLAKYYDPWPQHYGIGTSSLRVWYSRGNPHYDGTLNAPDPISGKQRIILPLPVMSPAQVYPETPSAVLNALEVLHKNWEEGNETAGIAAEPSRAYGLVRWFGAFAYITAQLTKYRHDMKKRHPAVAKELTWVSWEEEAEVGKNLRAHRDDWLTSWFAQNAHTYTTTVRAFEEVPRGSGDYDDEEFFRAFERASVEGVALIDELPMWFALEDPVRDLYERDPKEWARFAQWLANVTGQKLTEERKEQRKSAKKFADKSRAEQRDEAANLLTFYYEAVEKLAVISKVLGGHRDASLLDKLGGGVPDRDELNSEKKVARQDLRAATESLAAMGIPDPKESTDEVPHNISKRIIAILNKHLPADVGLSDANMFAGSDLFNPKYFKIDQAAHTVRFDPEARTEFTRRYTEQRDPELLLRRAARGMWEHAKTKDLVAAQPTGGDYGYMFSVMLSYMAWVVPGPGEMAAQVRSTGLSIDGVAAGKQWLRDQARLMKSLIYGEAAALTDEEIAAENKVSPEQAMEAKRELDLMLSIAGAQSVVSEGGAVFAAVAAELGVTEGGQGATMSVFAPRVGESRKKRKKSALPEVVSQPGGVVPTEPATPVEPAEPPPMAMREGERVLRSGILVRKRPGDLTPNPSHVSVSFLQGEPLPPHFYAWRPPARGGMHPNPERVLLLSPGVLAQMRSVIAGADVALPSPFRMIAAMLA